MSEQGTSTKRTDIKVAWGGIAIYTFINGITCPCSMGWHSHIYIYQWNNLPLNVRDLEINAFKKEVKNMIKNNLIPLNIQN